jgi:hypothetical protein
MAFSQKANYTNQVNAAASKASTDFCGSRVLRGQCSRSLGLLVSAF